MGSDLRPPPQRGRAPSAPAPFVTIFSDSLHIPGLEKLTAGYFRLTVGIFWLSAVSQSAPAASLRLLFRLFFGYLPRLRLRVFFCYLWAISGFLWNSMAVVGSGHHNAPGPCDIFENLIRGSWTIVTPEIFDSKVEKTIV